MLLWTPCPTICVTASSASLTLLFLHNTYPHAFWGYPIYWRSQGKLDGTTVRTKWCQRFNIIKEMQYILQLDVFPWHYACILMLQDVSARSRQGSIYVLQHYTVAHDVHWSWYSGACKRLAQKFWKRYSTFLRRLRTSTVFLLQTAFHCCLWLDSVYSGCNRMQRR